MKKLLVCFTVMLFIFRAEAQIDTCNIDYIFSHGRLNYFQLIEKVERNNREAYLNSSEKDQKRYNRWRSYFDYRVDVDGSFTTYVEHWKNYYLNSSNSTSGSLCLNWECLGPFGLTNYNMKNYNGRCQSVVVNPDNNNIVYLGTMSGGLFKTTNALAVNPSDVHWECLTEEYSSIGVFDIEIDPNDSGKMYIIASFYTSNIGNLRQYSVGVFKSEDGGNSFDLILDLDPADEIMLTDLEIASNGYIYVVGDMYENDRLYKSTNGGVSWSYSEIHQLNDDNIRLWELAISTNNPNYVIVSGMYGVFYSDNGGSSFSSIISNLNLATSSTKRYNAKFNSYDNKFYILYDGGNDGLLEKSTNGLNWTTVNANITDVYMANYVNELAITPQGNIFAGAVYMKYSGDGGQSFLLNTLEPSVQVHADVRDVAFSNSSNGQPVFIATDGGICRNTSFPYNNGTWQSINGDLCVGQFFGFDISTSNPDVMAGGLADNGTQKRNSDGSWTHILGSDGGSSAINPNDENNIVATSGWASVGVYYTSTGSSFSYSGLSLPKYDSPIISAPSIANTFYAGGWNLMRSTNSGISYSNFGTAGSGFVTAIDACRNDPTFIAYSKYIPWETPPNGEFVYTTNGGSNWVCIDEVNNPDFTVDFDLYPITDIEINPISNKDIWITFGGFNETEKIYYSDNKCADWTNITYNLPNIPVNDIEYDYVNGILFLGTDFGLYYLKNGFTIWEKYTCGLPPLVIENIDIHPKTGEIIIASYGRGVWRADLQCAYDPFTTITVSSNENWNIRSKISSDITVTNNATLTLSNVVKIVDEATVTVNSGSKLIIEGTGILEGGCDGYFGGIINIEPGAELEIKSNGKIKMGESGVVNVKYSANSVGNLKINPNSEIELHDEETLLNISGNLTIGNNATFTFIGDGYIKFSNPGNDNVQNIICGTSSSILISGSGQNDVVIEVQQNSVRFPSLTSLTISHGKILMGESKRLMATQACNEVLIDNILMTTTSIPNITHRGFTIYNQSNLTISNSIFEKGYEAFYINQTSGSSVNVQNCEFRSLNRGLYVYNKGINLEHCNFHDIQTIALGCYSMSLNSSIYNCDFVDNQKGIYYVGSASADLFVDVCDIISNDTYGIHTSGALDLTVRCTNINGNQCAIYTASGTNVFIDQNAYNDFSGNTMTINLQYGSIELNNGYNQLQAINNSIAINGFIPGTCGTTLLKNANHNRWSINQSTGPNYGSNYYLNIRNCTPITQVSLQDPTPGFTVCYQFDQNFMNSYNFNEEMENIQTNSDLPLVDISGNLSLPLDQALVYLSNMSCELQNESSFNEIINTYIDIIMLCNSYSNSTINTFKNKAYGDLHSILATYFQYVELNINNQNFIEAAIKIIELNENLISKTDIYSNYYIEYKLDIALLYRLIGQFDQSISICQNLISEVIQPELINEKSYIENWLCHISAEKQLIEGNINLEEFEEASAQCDELFFSCENDYFNDESIGDEEEVNPISINIQPNPSQGVFTVQVLNSTGQGMISITKSAGQIVFNHIYTGENISISGFTKGEYTLYYIENQQVKASTTLIVE